MEAFPAEVRARGGWEGGVSVTSGIWKERWGQARLLGLDAAVRERGGSLKVLRQNCVREWSRDGGA